MKLPLMHTILNNSQEINYYVCHVKSNRIFLKIGQMRHPERESFLDRLHEGADKMQQNVLFEMLKKDMSTEIVNRIKVILKGICRLFKSKSNVYLVISFYIETSL